MTEQSLISIIVLAYNVAGHIGPALASLQCQTYRNIEVVVNDGSTDATGKIAKLVIEKRMAR